MLQASDSETGGGRDHEVQGPSCQRVDSAAEKSSVRVWESRRNEGKNRRKGLPGRDQVYVALNFLHIGSSLNSVFERLTLMI